eukprot:jgi/Bigna1/67509/fgenesh1_pg.4_\
MPTKYEAKAPWWKSRLPYLFLGPASCTSGYCLWKASTYSHEVQGLAHNVGLFFYPGVVSSTCKDPILTKSYFMLHLQMALFVSLLAYSNRRGQALLRRVLHFSVGYLAVGIAIPVQFMTTGDSDLFAPWSKNDEYHHTDGVATVMDDADFDTYTTLFVNFGWFVLSHTSLMTTCEQEYKYPPGPNSTVFDWGTIVWAGFAMLPLILYKYRGQLPPFWINFGFTDPGTGYTGLAILNGIFVAAFFAESLLTGQPDRSSFFASLTSNQTEQYHYNFLGASLDYIFAAVTFAVLVYRQDKQKRMWLCMLTLMLPPVGFPLFLSKLRVRAQTITTTTTTTPTSGGGKKNK